MRWIKKRGHFLACFDFALLTFVDETAADGALAFDRFSFGFFFDADDDADADADADTGEGEGEADVDACAVGEEDSVVVAVAVVVVFVAAAVIADPEYSFISAVLFVHACKRARAACDRMRSG